MQNINLLRGKKFNLEGVISDETGYKLYLRDQNKAYEVYAYFEDKVIGKGENRVNASFAHVKVSKIDKIPTQKLELVPVGKIILSMQNTKDSLELKMIKTRENRDGYVYKDGVIIVPPYTTIFKVLKYGKNYDGITPKGSIYVNDTYLINKN